MTRQTRPALSGTRCPVSKGCPLTASLSQRCWGAAMREGRARRAGKVCVPGLPARAQGPSKHQWMVHPEEAEHQLMAEPAWNGSWAGGWLPLRAGPSGSPHMPAPPLRAPEARVQG